MSENEASFLLAIAFLMIAALGFGMGAIRERIKKLEHEIYVRGQGWRKP